MFKKALIALSFIVLVAVTLSQVMVVDAKTASPSGKIKPTSPKTHPIPKPKPTPTPIPTSPQLTYNSQSGVIYTGFKRLLDLR